MADNESLIVDGRPISSLRVVDLKKECEKRSLPKSGSKSQLFERLKTHLLLEKLQQPSDSDYSSDAGFKNEEEGEAQNEFIKQYLERQKLLLEGGDTETEKVTATETEQSDTSVTEVSSPVKQQQSVEEPTVTANSEIVNSPDSKAPQQPESTVDTTTTDCEKQAVSSSPDKLDTVDPEPSAVSASAVNSAKEQQVEPVESSPVKPDSISDNQEPVQQSADKEDKDIIPDTERQIAEDQDSEESSSSEEDMGRSKRKSGKHEGKTDKKEKESSRRSHRKSEKMEEDEEEKHVENGKKIDDSPVKDLGAAGDTMGVGKDNEIVESAKTNGVERDVKGSEENANNSAEFNAKQRRGSGPTDMDTSEEKGDKQEQEDRRGKKGSHSDGRISRRKSDEKMETEVTSSHEKAKQKHATKRHSGRKTRKQSSSSSRSRSRSRSRSQSPIPAQRSKGRMSRSSSSDSSRSRSPPTKTKSAIMSQRQAPRPPSRSSSSSRSRSRSPTPKRVKKVERSDSESSRSRSRTPPPQKPSEDRRSRSRSSSRSRSRSPIPEKMSADSTEEPPIDHQEKSFYTEEEESPLPVKVKSRASLETGEKKATEPIKSGLSEVKEAEEESEISQTETSMTEIAPETEKPVIPVKHTKKISLNRGKSSEGAKPSEGEGEKTEEGEKPAKKRKWGSKSTTSLQNKPKKTSSVTISTESLKGLMPDLKPSLKLAEPVMEEMDYEDDEDVQSTTAEQQQQQQQQPEDTRDVKIQRTVTQDVKDNPDSPASSDDEDGDNERKIEVKEEEDGEPPIKKERKKSDEETITKTITITRKEKSDQKIVRQVSHKPAIPLIKPDEPEAARRSPSPARNPAGKIVHVRNLVRPFTLGQLKELLRRTGPFDEDSFWIDKIKSHCFVTYENVEDAKKTRQALHNTRWPHSNPKTLAVDFGTEEQVEFHKKEEMPKTIFPQKDKATLRKEREAKREQERQEREKELEKRRMEREKRQKEREEREQRNKPRPVREWDKEKLEKGDWDKERSRSRSPRARQRSEGSESPVRERRLNRDKRERKEKAADEPPAKLLDDLFRKTKTTPCIYWLPLTEAQAEEREKARKNRIQDRLKNLAATELSEDKPSKENRRGSPAAREGRNKTKGSPSPRRGRSSDERPRRISDERPRHVSADRPKQRDRGRDSRSRSRRRR